MNMHLSLIVAMMLSFYTCVCALWANHVEKFTLHLKQWDQCGKRVQDKVQLQGASKTLVHEHTSRGLCTQVMPWSRHDEAAQSSYQAAWTLRILTPRTMASLQRRQVRSLALWL